MLDSYLASKKFVSELKAVRLLGFHIIRSQSMGFFIRLTCFWIINWVNSKIENNFCVDCTCLDWFSTKKYWL